MPSRNHVDDFRNDGGIPPKQALNTAINTNTHLDRAVSCTVCSYSWTPRIAHGNDPKRFIRCPNCNFSTATGL